MGHLMLPALCAASSQHTASSTDPQGREVERPVQQGILYAKDDALLVTLLDTYLHMYMFCCTDSSTK
jgi:hypothetical protein